MPYTGELGTGWLTLYFSAVNITFDFLNFFILSSLLLATSLRYDISFTCLSNVPLHHHNVVLQGLCLQTFGPSPVLSVKGGELLGRPLARGRGGDLSTDAHLCTNHTGMVHTRSFRFGRNTCFGQNMYFFRTKWTRMPMSQNCEFLKVYMLSG